MAANRHGENRGIRSDGHVACDFCFFPKRTVAAGGGTCLEKVINEHDTVRDEAVFANRHELADERVRLDFAAGSDRDAPLNFDERPNKAVIPDGTFVKIAWLNDRHPFSESDIPDPSVEQPSRLDHHRGQGE